ncbi:protein-disulfide reductase, partial [Paucibacter sp. XJ19-41]|nr:protein-disulfide reductase [Paucibacter sp. XJ19-41]
PQALQARIAAAVEGPQLALRIDGLPAAWRGRELQAFPEEAGVFDHAAAPTLQWEGEVLKLRLPLSAQRSESPAALQLVLRPAGEPGARLAYAVAAWPAGVAA